MSWTVFLFFKNSKHGILSNEIVLMKIIIFVIIVLISGGLFLLSKAPSVPNDYTQKVETSGKIEARYIQKGSHAVKHFSVPAVDVLKKHLVYYPDELESSDQIFPVIFSLNGTGVAGSKYTAVFEHFASLGFIVLGNEYSSTGFGTTADKISHACVRWIMPHTTWSALS